MSRVESSVKNIKYAMVGQLLIFLAGFITRMIFVRTLSSQYLGLNGLFSNILQILSLSEMGIGTAIVFSMYKPLSERDEPKLQALMKLYSKAYIGIGLLILITGSALTPFLSFFIKQMPDIPHLQLIYLMYVASSGISYFFSYKRSFLIADQKKYIDAYYHNIIFLAFIVLQNIALLLTHNFILYLSLQIISTFTENVIVTRKIDKLYPFLTEKNDARLEKEEMDTIFKNVKALILHRLGDVAVMQTANLLISKYVGIVEVGMYSNYMLLISAVNAIFTIFFQSISAGVGNLGATESIEKKMFIFRCLDLFGFWLYGFAAICFVCLANPFIFLWVGKEYMFPITTVLFIIGSYYLTGRRESVLSFKSALGLYWQDRYKPLFEAGIMLAVSIILAQKIGVPGVFLGMIISTLTTVFWVEPFVVYRYGFNAKVRSYFAQYAMFTAVMLAAGGATWFACGFFASYSLTDFIARMFICAIVPNALFAAVFWRTKELQYLINIMKPMLDKLLRKMKIRKVANG